jgi:hypothetical protein
MDKRERIDTFVMADTEMHRHKAWRRDRTKLYAQARAYWREINDTERLSLTDEQLDEQFWCFDSQSIPRLKSDQDKVILPPDGLLAMAEASEREGFSAPEPEIDYRQILNQEFPEYLRKRMQDGDDNSTTD